MMNYYQLARLFNRSHCYDLSVWRKSENEYWVTNTLIMVRLKHNEFCKFKSRYCAYRYNPYIPDLGAGRKLRIMDDNVILNEAPNMQLILDDVVKAKDIIITQLILVDPNCDGQFIIYTGEDFAGAMSLDYFNLFGRDYEYKTRDFNNPVFVLKDKEIIGVIMPLWNNGNIENEIEKVGEKI
jgi:hypothetical protein